LDVLAINPGSSSLRFQLVAVERAAAQLVARPIGGGGVAGIGGAATWRASLAGAVAHSQPANATNHLEALDLALAWLDEQRLASAAIGVRVVHGGGGLGTALAVDDHALAALRRACELAPLHDRPSLDVIERLREHPGRRPPIVAVFDSAFHAQLPEVARAYALPRELCERHGIRRLGFHGLALRSLVERLRELEGRVPQRVVAAHLGGGCSVTALRDGLSIDTSMGYTPLEGLVMSTRCGDVDPSLVALLAHQERCSPEAIVELFNKRSGLLGVFGRSGDMREIERARALGDPRATLAFDLFVHSARKHLAAQIAVLGGVDLVTFSGGIGENSAAVRAAILRGMEWCGIELDPARNQAGRRDELVSRDGARVAVRMVGVAEEPWIARAACEHLEDRARTS
jgi:acetate kinase